MIFHRTQPSESSLLLIQLGIERSSLGGIDLLRETIAGISARPSRMILTAMGTVLGVAAFVATIGIAQTASHQVSSRFDTLRATQINAIDLRPDDPEQAFPDDTGPRLEALNGVVAAGELWIAAERAPVRTLPRIHPLDHLEPLTILAATPSALDAMTLRLRTGRVFDEFHDRRAEPVALLGSAAAQRLGITRVDDGPAVFINDVAFTVLGIFDESKRRPDAVLQVIVPASTAKTFLPLSQSPHEVLVQVAPGAAGTIGRQLPYALRPQDPDRYSLTVPPDPATLRGNVEADLNALFLILASVALVIGIIGITNTTLVAVLERTPEFGLRRAVGARPRHIALHVLAEAAALGTIGGFVGATLGTLVVLGVSIANTWTAVLDPRLALTAPFIGTLTGVLAGMYPAYRATRVQPAEALRR